MENLRHFMEVAQLWLAISSASSQAKNGAQFFKVCPVMYLLDCFTSETEACLDFLTNIWPENNQQLQQFPAGNFFTRLESMTYKWELFYSTVEQKALFPGNCNLPICLFSMFTWILYLDRKGISI